MQRRVPDLAKLQALDRLRAEGATRRDPRPRDRLLHVRTPDRGREPGRVPADVRGRGGPVVVRGHARDQPTRCSRSRSALARTPPPSRGRRLLDAGCGTGSNLRHFGRLGTRRRHRPFAGRPRASAGSAAWRPPRASAPGPARSGTPPSTCVTSFDVIYHAWVTDDRAAVAGDGARAASRRAPPRARSRPALLWGAHDARSSRAIATRAASCVPFSRTAGLEVRAGHLLQLSSCSPCSLLRRTPRPPDSAAHGSDVGFLPAPLEWALPAAARGWRPALVRRGFSLPRRRQRDGPRPQAGLAMTGAVEARGYNRTEMRAGT